MNEDKASPADRFLIRGVLSGFGNPDSLQNVNVDTLPNGACCYVIAEHAIWSLDKFVNSDAIAGLALPAMGGGTWFLQSASAAFAGGAEVLSTDYNTFAVGGTWGQTSTANSALTGTPANWTFTPTGFILTYTGESRDFYVTLAGSARVGNADAERRILLGISRNNDLTGSPSFGTSGAVEDTLATPNVGYAITTVRKVTLASGDTLRPKMTGESAAVSLSAVLRMIVAPG